MVFQLFVPTLWRIHLWWLFWQWKQLQDGRNLLQKMQVAFLRWRCSVTVVTFVLLPAGCVCQSRQSRKLANRKLDAGKHFVIFLRGRKFVLYIIFLFLVVLLRINSARKLRGERGSYIADVLKVCTSKPRSSQHLYRGDIALLYVNEGSSADNCTCPKLDKEITYRVGVDISGRSGKIWELNVPRNFYVKEARGCRV